MVERVESIYQAIVGRFMVQAFFPKFGIVWSLGGVMSSDRLR